MFPCAPSHSLFHSTPYPDPSHRLHSQSYPISTSSNMDPAAVDFRAFYPYTPNEVKHRKRTTSAQLKILEGIFKHDTKPNAALRNELAVQLDMTARGVQVWFQNRRAKEKTKASKVAASTNQSPSASSDTALKDAVHGHENASELSFPRDLPELSTDPSSQESSPTSGSPPHLQLVTESSHASWQSSPLATPDDFRQQVDFSDVCFIRRGSLPVDAFPLPEDCHGPPLVGHLDPFTRRRSVDASLHRLAHNPYAGLARAKHSGLAGPRISGHLADNFSSARNACLSHHTGTPSGLQLSQHGSLHTRHSSMESRPFRCSPPSLINSSSPSPLSPYYSIRSSLPDNSLFAFSSRTVAAPIPGPLPSPDFSFGAPGVNIHSSESDRGSPDSSHGYLFRGDEFDTEDDATSASYDGFSRFGSIASVANSDSSNTSAYYSEVGSCVSENELGSEVNLQSRRASCTPSHFVGLMSGLNVANETQGNLTNGVFEQSHPMALKEGDRAPTYPSPTSTISRGSSPPGVNSANVTVTSSNELSYPIQTNDQSIINLHSGSPILDGETSFYNQDNNSFPPSGFGDYHPFTSVDGQDNVDHYSPEGYHQAQESYCMNPSISTSQFL
ncbi:hypothetical protein E1B28_000632 [Marasmius oreades]|uniref:Homeobox domain-containing protein n=1 Tax=Marasmius oreades TaxID=181124 RepID=A0A9P7V1U1_9AGAR|nr:uncharacterized protein E1B28_000632 [Marasmius oreades]KAG7098719.1 hypothetical protein E1B28_000632 [Marasmius oreades]